MAEVPGALATHPSAILARGQEGQVYLCLLLTLWPIGCEPEDASEQPAAALCLPGGQAVEATAGEVCCLTPVQAPAKASLGLPSAGKSGSGDFPSRTFLAPR